jgi:hypothetical protein
MAMQKKDGTPRSKPVRRVIHIFEVLDDGGNPVKVNKANINTIVATSDTGKALDMMESGSHPHAVFVRAELV